MVRHASCEQIKNRLVRAVKKSKICRHTRIAQIHLLRLFLPGNIITLILYHKMANKSRQFVLRTFSITFYAHFAVVSIRWKSPSKVP